MPLVKKGEPLQISAAAWNDVNAIVAAWRAGKLDVAAGGNAVPRPQTVIVKNGTSSNLSAFSILGLGDPLIDFTVGALSHELYGGLRWNGVSPSTSTPHYGRYAITQEPVVAGGLVRAAVHGVTLAWLSVTHSADTACEITNNDPTRMTTGAVGTSRILWKESGTGVRIGLIRLGDAIDQFFGKADGSISVGSSGTVSVWDAAFSGDLGNNVTGCYNHSVAISAGDKVAGVVVNGVPVVAKLNC